MAKQHARSINDNEQYEELREQGMSKEKAARIANTTRSIAGERGGKSERYDDWSEGELRERAQAIGIEGRSKMDKDGLIEALREH